MDEYIIFSPSKEMDRETGQESPVLERQETQMAVEELRSYSPEGLSQKMKISNELAQQVYENYQTIDQAKAKKAIDTYQGLSFRQLDQSLKTSDFLENHLRILSALYGPLAPSTPINPYRLDFTMSIKYQGQSLKKLWKEYYRHYFQGKRLYNLASAEFASLVDQKETELIQIVFYANFDGGKKVHSATAKKLRGKLLNHLTALEDLSEDSFQSFEEDGFKLVFYSLSDHQVIYERQ